MGLTFGRRLNDATPEEWDAASRNESIRTTVQDSRDEQWDRVESELSKRYEKTDPMYKYNEGNLIAEFKKYVDATYGEHYSRDKFQATEFIIDGGHGTGFCIGNVLKYAQRYGKKGTSKDARKDLMKVLHYALIQLYIHDTENS